jgi:hypothetical protein
VFAPAVFENTQSPSGNRFCFGSSGILFTQPTTWVLISCCFAHFISRRAKLNTARAKTAPPEILLLKEIQG